MRRADYTGSSHQLQGCHQDVHNMLSFLAERGYPTDSRSMVVLADDRDPRGQFFPTGRNILAAMDWLVSEPNTCCFLHYSGHGEEHFVEDWKGEKKHVFMYSGCRDDQTSADATITGSHVGAMSWAFLQ